VSDESPWEYVQRRRREGAKNEALRQELLARGVEFTDVQILLDRTPAQTVTPETGTPKGASESAWSVLQRMRAEGFSQSQIEAELARQGHDRADIAALFADDPMRVAPGRRAPDPTASTVDVIGIVFGLALITVGVVVLVSGRVGVFSFMLIISGVTRIANAARAQQGSLPEATLAQSLRPLADEDPRARCQRHPSFASIGTCPRCGTFCCARCVTKPGLRPDHPCLACQRLPTRVEDQLRQLRKRTALRLLIGPALLALIFTRDLDQSSEHWLGVANAVAIASAPWLALAALQALTSTFWPTWLSVGLWTLMSVLFAIIALDAGTAFAMHSLPWVFGLWPAIAARRAASRIVQEPVPLIPEDEPVPDR